MAPPAIIRCTRAAAALALLAAAVALGGCEGKGGAVSVRWRVVDLASGIIYDPEMLKVDDGSCCGNNNNNTFCGSNNSWIIETVSIVLESPSGQSDGGTGDFGLTPFPCSIREKTTPFTLPEGTFAITIDVVNVDGAPDHAPQPVALPPPSVRTIVAGNVVNLDVIEIGVNPIPR
jgi:hypothetical protein